jgi:hypothetical protein
MGLPLHKATSAERLESYRRDPNEGDEILLSRYLWNVALCEALYPVLTTLEIALRNAIHDAASSHFGSIFWLSDGSMQFQPYQQGQINDAVFAIGRRSRPLTAGRLVAELSLGFWTSLLDRPYEQVLWPALLPAVFPGMPRRRRTRANAAGRLGAIRKLRNRVYDNEPVLYRHDLTVLHAEVKETIGWIGSQLLSVVNVIDRFSTVHQSGEAAYLPQLRTLLARPP